jgi:hypothetical protein
VCVGSSRAAVGTNVGYTHALLFAITTLPDTFNLPPAVTRMYIWLPRSLMRTATFEALAAESTVRHEGDASRAGVASTYAPELGTTPPNQLAASDHTEEQSALSTATANESQKCACRFKVGCIVGFAVGKNEGLGKATEGLWEGCKVGIVGIGEDDGEELG